MSIDETDARPRFGVRQPSAAFGRSPRCGASLSLRSIPKLQRTGALQNARTGGVPPLSRSRSGVALVLVLAFSVLLMGLVLAFFTQATSHRQITEGNTSGVLADVIARSAAEMVIGDLKQEMKDGSATLGTPPIYTPTAPENMVPAPAGLPAASPNPIPNLVKRSARGVPFYPNGVTRASASASDTPSRDGRFINKTRWNASYLVPKFSTSGDSSQPLDVFEVPDWIVVTADGKADPVTTGNLGALRDPKNAGFAVGRFAYLVFDQGGLLDANVAGYPAGIAADKIGGKSALSFADLGTLQVTGSSTLGQTGVNRIVGWRNFATAQAGPAFPPATPTFGSLNGYLDYVTKDAAGFMKIPSATFGPKTLTDQRLLSRRELIDLRRSLGISVNALQFMTHFTRELDAPSWGPTYNASDVGGSGTFAYKSDASGTGAVNPLIPTVRAGGGTITTYRNNGTSFTYPVKAGEPLVQRRFPLGRLAWIGKNGPQNGGTAESIKACFGLKWDATNLAWEYTSPTGTSVQPDATIKKLSEISGREPDFFELLKAGVLAGATGLRVGDSYFKDSSNPPKYFSPVPDYYENTDRHVFQLGANIIDQWDADSYPTRLNVGTTFESPSLVAGSENIPYLYEWTFSAYRPRANTNFFHFWLEPVLWNPYSGPVTDAPTRYVYRLNRGTMRGYANPNGDGSNRKAAFPQVVATADVTLGVGSLSQNLSQATSNPTYLAQLLDAGANVTTPVDPVSGTNGEFIEEKVPGNALGTTYVGFWLGKSLPPSTASMWVNLNTDSARLVVLADYGGGKLLEVQRTDLGRMDGFWKGGVSGNQLGRRFDRFGFPDPRTGRLGLHNTDPGSGIGTLNRSNYWGPGLGLQAKFLARSRAQNLSVDPDYTFADRYLFFDDYRFADNTGDPMFKDKDGVQRPGDGTWISDSANSLPSRVETKYRPIILNRPFRNVAELGFAFSDIPWRSLDLSSPKSADAGLLDLFTTADVSPTAYVAGKINLNTRNSAALATVLAGVSVDVDPTTPTTMPATVAKNIANAIVAHTGNTATAGPILNKSELATRVMQDAGVLSAINASASNDDRLIKARREAVVRALSETGQTRTWNLLIDVVAQSGRFTTAATSLDDFVVKGERRYWVHVAIDRITGEVIDREIEPVIE